MVAQVQPAGPAYEPPVETYYDPTKDVNAADGLTGTSGNPALNTQLVGLNNTQDTASQELTIADTGASVFVRGGDPTLLAGNVGPGPSGIATNQSPVNFRAIPADRKAQLDGRAEGLINQYASSRSDPRVSPNGMPLNDPNHVRLDYNSFKNILTDLKNDRSMSDNEKAYVWSKIADAKGSPTPLGGHQGGSYRPSINGANPAIVDSEAFGLRRNDTPSHSVVSFNDGVHGFGSHDGRPGMGYYTRSAAYHRIDDYETQSFPRGILSPPFGYNAGDANASKGMVDAFHAYRDAATGHKFEAFANTWIDRMVAR